VENNRKQTPRERRHRRTLVVDGVPEAENGEDRSVERRGGRVLAVEEARLDSAASASGRGALGELRVELDERGEASALPRRLEAQMSVSSQREHIQTRTSRDGAAIFGGTSPPSWRRMREACMAVVRKAGRGTRRVARLCLAHPNNAGKRRNVINLATFHLAFVPKLRPAQPSRRLYKMGPSLLLESNRLYRYFSRAMSPSTRASCRLWTVTDVVLHAVRHLGVSGAIALSVVRVRASPIVSSAENHAFDMS
jgi:hypothetical protein